MPARQPYSFKRQLMGAIKGILVCILSMPVAITITIALFPAWSWLEKVAPIEAVGHSGPAEWCYIFTYIIVLSLAGVIWSRLRKSQHPDES